jgi:hypothetical protein
VEANKDRGGAFRASGRVRGSHRHRRARAARARALLHASACESLDVMSVEDEHSWAQDFLGTGVLHVECPLFSTACDQ